MQHSNLKLTSQILGKFLNSKENPQTIFADIAKEHRTHCISMSLAWQLIREWCHALWWSGLFKPNKYIYLFIYFLWKSLYFSRCLRTAKHHKQGPQVNRRCTAMITAQSHSGGMLRWGAMGWSRKHATGAAEFRSTHPCHSRTQGC